MMTRQEFRATRIEHAGGFVYLPDRVPHEGGEETIEGLCIEKLTGGRLSVALGAGHFEARDEEEAERVLYAWARSEGLCGPHAEGDEPDPVIPFRAFQATRTRSEDLAKDVPDYFGGDENGEPTKGFLYWGSGVIEEYVDEAGVTKWQAILGNYNPASDDLEAIEHELYVFVPGLGFGYRAEVVPVMTFAEFRASRRHFDDIRVVTDDSYDLRPGFGYAVEPNGKPYVAIEEASRDGQTKRYALTLDRSIFEDDDLEKLERMLYDWCVEEGLIEVENLHAPEPKVADLPAFAGLPPRDEKPFALALAPLGEPTEEDLYHARELRARKADMSDRTRLDWVRGLLRDAKTTADEGDFFTAGEMLHAAHAHATEIVHAATRHHAMNVCEATSEFFVASQPKKGSR